MGQLYRNCTESEVKAKLEGHSAFAYWSAKGLYCHVGWICRPKPNFPVRTCRGDSLIMCRYKQLRNVSNVAEVLSAMQVKPCTLWVCSQLKTASGNSRTPDRHAPSHYCAMGLVELLGGGASCTAPDCGGSAVYWPNLLDGPRKDCDEMTSPDRFLRHSRENQAGQKTPRGLQSRAPHLHGFQTLWLADRRRNGACEFEWSKTSKLTRSLQNFCLLREMLFTTCAPR